MGITTKVVSDLEERLTRARETAGVLEVRRRAALEELRQSIQRLQDLGAAITRSRRPAQPAPVNGNASARGAGALGLAEHFGLSLRELEVALLIAEGLSNREIALTVRVSTHTARHHTQHVLGKLSVRSRSRAAALINEYLDENHRGLPST